MRQRSTFHLSNLVLRLLASSAEPRLFLTRRFTRYWVILSGRDGLRQSRVDPANTIPKLPQRRYEKKGVREKPDIWIVRGQNNILDKIRETLGRTRRELFVAMPVVPDPIVSMALPVLALMKGKGVNVSVMVPQTTSRETIRKLKGLAQVRTREQMFGGGIISDDNQIIILLGEDPQKGLTLAISSDHIGLVKFGKSYFEYLWESSKPLS